MTKTSKESKKPEKKIPKQTAKKNPKNKPEKRTFPYIFLRILLYSGWATFIIVALQFLVFLIFTKIFGNFSDNPLIFAFYSLIYYSLSVLVIIFLPKKILKKQTASREDLGLKDLPTFSDIGLSPVAFIIYLIFATILTALFSLFPWFNANEAQNLGLNTYMNSTEMIFTFFSVAIIASIAEEIIFRGWLYDKLRNLFPGKLSIVFSILIVSAIFGLIHDQFNVAVNVFAMSVVCCLLREITGTIYSGILLHILKNTIAFLLVYVYHIL